MRTGILLMWYRMFSHYNKWDTRPIVFLKLPCCTWQHQQHNRSCSSSSATERTLQFPLTVGRTVYHVERFALVLSILSSLC